MYELYLSIQDTVGSLQKLCKFLNMDRDQDFLREVVKLTSMESLSNYHHKKENQFSRKNVTELIYRKGM